MTSVYAEKTKNKNKNNQKTKNEKSVQNPQNTEC